jgi:hypothetical protein
MVEGKRMVCGKSAPALNKACRMTSILATRQVDFEDVLQENAKRKFFIFQQQVESYRLFFVPCWFVMLDYKVTIFGKNSTREGRLAFIYDEQRGCCVIDPDIRIARKELYVNAASVLPRRLTCEQAEKKVKTEARWKVVMAQYKRPPELFTVGVRKFYRPYFQTEVSFMGKQSIQWIPADGYDSYFTYQ